MVTGLSVMVAKPKQYPSYLSDGLKGYFSEPFSTFLFIQTKLCRHPPIQKQTLFQAQDLLGICLCAVVSHL